MRALGPGKRRAGDAATKAGDARAAAKADDEPPAIGNERMSGAATERRTRQG